MALTLLVFLGPPSATPSQTALTTASSSAHDDNIAFPGPGSFSPNFAAGSGPGGFAALPSASVLRGRSESLTSSSTTGGGERRAVGDVTRALLQVLAVMQQPEAGAVSSGARAYELLQLLLQDIHVGAKPSVDRPWNALRSSNRPTYPTGRRPGEAAAGLPEGAEPRLQRRRAVGTLPGRGA